MKRISFRQAIKEFGYEIVEYHRGYNFRSAFAKKIGGDDQLYYFHIEDLRDKHPFVYYRTAERIGDYRGGTNCLDMEGKLEERGFEIYEPRRKCDFNSN